MKRYYIKISESGAVTRLIIGFDTEDDAGKWYENNLLDSPSIKNCTVSLVDTSDGTHRDYETDKDLYFEK